MFEPELTPRTIHLFWYQYQVRETASLKRMEKKAMEMSPK
jgi:hypothetical protein